MSNTFTVGSVQLRYSRLYHNEAYQNERSIEVALGRWFVEHSPKPLHAVTEPVIEVGCVLPYYGPTEHEVVDLADEHPSSRKVNALSLDYTGRRVLSISTIEHMQSSEYGNASDEDSITFLRKVTSEAERYLVTWGIGYNPVLDAWVKVHPEIPRTFLFRRDWKNTYTQVSESFEPSLGGKSVSIWDTPFGHSDRPIPAGYHNNANVVVLVTNVPELLAAEGVR